MPPHSILHLVPFSCQLEITANHQAFRGPRRCVIVASSHPVPLAEKAVARSNGKLNDVSMYHVNRNLSFTDRIHEWLIFMGNVGKYTVHGSSGLWRLRIPPIWQMYHDLTPNYRQKTPETRPDTEVRRELIIINRGNIGDFMGFQ